MAKENQVEPKQITKEPQQVTTKKPQQVATKEPQQVTTKEPQQVTTKEPQQVTTKEPQRVTTKYPKKVEAGTRLAESNRKKREVKKREQAKLEASGVNQYYRIGAIIALGTIGGLGYYIYQTKKGEQQQSEAQKIILNHILRRNCRPTSFRWINLFC